MRFVSALLTAFFAFMGIAGTAQAAPALSIVFSGNSWGYLKPCPT